MIIKTDTNIFENIQFALDLPLNTPPKAKRELREKITSNGGVVSYIVTAKSKFVIIGNETDSDKDKSSYKRVTAQKLKIPIIGENFIDACLEAGKLLEPTKDIEDNTPANQNGGWLEKGKIEVEIDESIKPKRRVNLKTVKIWKYKDPKGPDFHTRPHKIVKVAIFKGRKKGSGFNVLEVHVITAENHRDDFKACLFIHRGYVGPTPSENGVKECQYFAVPNEAVSAFAQMWNSMANPPNSMQRITQTGELHLSSTKNLGSDEFKFENWFPDLSAVDSKVQLLVNSLWQDAEEELNGIFKCRWRSLTLETLSEAQGILVMIYRILTEPESQGDVDKLLTEYLSVTLREHERFDINIKNIVMEYNLCQLARDRLNLEEMAEANPFDSMKYKALRCRINCLSEDQQEYRMVKKMIPNEISIRNIYSLSRQGEDEVFKMVGNEKLLMHATPEKHLIGIMLRGLLLPKLSLPVMETSADISQAQKDIVHSLGPGLYFGENINAVVQYTDTSKSRGTRFLLVNEVSLGNSMEVFNHNSELTVLPEGYESVIGVKSTPEVPSDFQEDEYVIYNENQQKLNYLIEFHLPGDKVIPEPELKPEPLQEVEHINQDHIDPGLMSEFQDILHPKLSSSVQPKKSGLQSVDGKGIVTLKSVAVRGSLMDLSGEVTILQEYLNDSDNKIEAKYYFPLDEMATVCEFEAYLNGRRVVGRIAEKKEARKQYQVALKQGKSALLMDQETPDLFSVSIGNVLPHTTVLIRIKYVTELDIEGDLVSFRLSGTVSNNTLPKPDDPLTIDANNVKPKVSLELYLEMPYDIKTITSYTHRINIKKTATFATIRLMEGEQLNSSGFHLLIGLAEIHVPRMWTEEDEEHGTQACMLTFYPEFVSSSNREANVQVVILMDNSNSMEQNDCTSIAQKVAMLCLHHLNPDFSFNVGYFGKTYEELFPDCVPHSLDYIHDAQKFIGCLTADQGDSYLGKYLESQFLAAPSPGTTRNILVISDGHISDNNKHLLKKVRSAAGSVRVFSLAVGHRANRHFMRALSQAGAGAFEAFDHDSTNWLEKIQQVMSKMSSPVVKDISVEWQIFNTHGQVLQSPRNITTLFSGNRVVVYGILKGANSTMATLKAKLQDGGEVSTVVSPYNVCMSTGRTIHQLTTRAVVRDWETGLLDVDRTDHEVAKKQLEPQLVELSKMYSVVTPLTSFLAIDEEYGEVSEMVWEELLAKESVDKLAILLFESDTEEEKAVEDRDREMELDESDEVLAMDVSLCQRYDSDESEDIVTDNHLRLLSHRERKVHVHDPVEGGLAHGSFTYAPMQTWSPPKLCKSSGKGIAKIGGNFSRRRGCPRRMERPEVIIPESETHQSENLTESHFQERSLPAMCATALSRQGFMPFGNESFLKSQQDAIPQACHPPPCYSQPMMSKRMNSNLQINNAPGSAATVFGSSNPSPGIVFASGRASRILVADSGSIGNFRAPVPLSTSSLGTSAPFRLNFESPPALYGTACSFGASAANSGSFGLSRASQQQAPCSFSAKDTATAEDIPAIQCSDYDPTGRFRSSEPVSFGFLEELSDCVPDSSLSQDDVTMVDACLDVCDATDSFDDFSCKPRRMRCMFVNEREFLADEAEEEIEEEPEEIVHKKIKKKRKVNKFADRDYCDMLDYQDKECEILPSSPEAWVSLTNGCGSFGNGLPFCFTAFSIFCNKFKNEKLEAIQIPANPSQINDRFCAALKNGLEAMRMEQLGSNCLLGEVIRSVNQYGGFDEDNMPVNQWNTELWEEICGKLKTKGLNSLPLSASKAVYGIICSLAVAFEMLKKIRPSCLPLRLVSKEEITGLLERELEAAERALEDNEDNVENFAAVLLFLAAIAWVINLNGKHPMLYRTLELGNCWEEAFQKLTDGKSLLVL